MRDKDIQAGGTVVRVRDGGDPEGEPVIHFHGTPGSRLELAWADEIASDAGVRLIAFDRPGYGGTKEGPFSLASVAAMAVEIADRLGLSRFRTTGWSGGGPFALATAAAAGDRVLSVGVISGAGPFQLIPGALEDLSEGDREAVRLLPGDPAGAAAKFVEGFRLSDALASPEQMYEAFEPLLSDTDRQLWSAHADAMHADMREALAQGSIGCGWDNVAWIGEWDFDLAEVRCPVLLWYGSEDRMAKPAHPRWLSENIPTSRLTTYEGEGHLLALAHLPGMMRDLLAA